MLTAKRALQHCFEKKFHSTYVQLKTVHCLSLSSHNIQQAAIKLKVTLPISIFISVAAKILHLFPKCGQQSSSLLLPTS
jgi:hypothetical protein